MQCPRVEINGKSVIVLSGYRQDPVAGGSGSRTTVIEYRAMRRLHQAVLNNPDAVAFGFTAGNWVSAA